MASYIGWFTVKAWHIILYTCICETQKNSSFSQLQIFKRLWFVFLIFAILSVKFKKKIQKKEENLNRKKNNNFSLRLTDYIYRHHIVMRFVHKGTTEKRQKVSWHTFTHSTFLRYQFHINFNLWFQDIHIHFDYLNFGYLAKKNEVFRLCFSSFSAFTSVDWNTNQNDICFCVCRKCIPEKPVWNQTQIMSWLPHFSTFPNNFCIIQ